MRDKKYVDGRTIPSRMYTIIITANYLHDAVLEDWTGFNQDDEDFKATLKVTDRYINDFLFEINSENRTAQLLEIKTKNQHTLHKMSPISFSKWEAFVKHVQQQCPSLSDNELEKIAEILATLELSSNKYQIIHKLAEFDASQHDELFNILDQWSVEYAKIVLDEIRQRVTLVDKLSKKTRNINTYEVQELQPLFNQGLWIFGPEFESIEFTSNQTMRSVLKKLFNIEESEASSNRPDFVIIPSGTASIYGAEEFDEDMNLCGVNKLVIVELKKPGVKIGLEEKMQTWKYIKELKKQGVLKDNYRAHAFVLGSLIEQGEASPYKTDDDRCIIRPMLFDTVLRNARHRLFKLEDKIKQVPFLNTEEVKEFLSPDIPNTIPLEMKFPST